MSGWMIGFGIVGAFMGAAVGIVKELTHDWNGGTSRPKAALHFAKAVAIGGVVGVGLGWLMTDSKTKEEVAIEECYKGAPAGGTVTITRAPGGIKCEYKP